ncbi:MAG: HisA/HisF-related TIM barrel protein, partial [Gemmatimonadaceae bacterium]
EHSAQFQVSTDVRRRDQVDDLLAAGARFVVVGSKGIDDLDWLAEIVADDSGTVIVAVDVSTRRVHVPTAQPGMPRDAADWIHDLSHLALGAVLIRSVDGQGQSAPCDFPLLEELVEDFAFPILAAGVLQTVGELDALQDRGVAGALLGECLHTGRIDPWIAAQEFRS